MLNFIKEKVKKIYSAFTNKVNSIFSKDHIDDELLKELEVLLLSADTGSKTTKRIIDSLKEAIDGKKINNVLELKQALGGLLISHLEQYTNQNKTPKVLLLVGINGSGKTTFSGKFAYKLASEGKKVLLVAGDTFRAAAIEQLSEWGKRINVDVFIGKTNQDPASVIFDSCVKFVNEGYDHLIIDTAGRVQTKINLMNELEKMRKIINKKLPDEDIKTWLTIDSMLGQNSFEQAKIFNEVASLNGIILTKMDGTGKGGIVFSITKELKLPILYITFGEKVEDLKLFSPEEYVKNLLGEQ
ncbi:signal recognition particle-docking protein FtsY [Candidatus Babeliales bacterium]|nr:signal recognition particle-docking protein FtsY [Candidatus Babeliales bacterium]